MKTTECIIAASLALGTALVSIAAPAAKRTYTASALKTLEEIQALEPEGKIAMVCTRCSTVTVAELGSSEQIMSLCKEGASVVCSSCKQAARVVRRGPRSKDGKATELRYVNERGDECMFVAKLQP